MTVSDGVNSLVATLISAICADSGQWFVWYCAIHLATHHPHLFAIHDLFGVFAAAFELGRVLADSANDPEAHVEDLLAVTAAHHLLAALTVSPALADVLRTWGFDHFDEFDVGPAALFFDVLAFVNIESTTVCLTADFSKYDRDFGYRAPLAPLHVHSVRSGYDLEPLEILKFGSSCVFAGLSGPSGHSPAGFRDRLPGFGETLRVGLRGPVGRHPARDADDSGGRGTGAFGGGKVAGVEARR
jgi:hypothetical protein